MSPIGGIVPPPHESERKNPMRTKKPQITRPGTQAATMAALVDQFLVSATPFRGHDGFGWNATLRIDGKKIEFTDDGYGGGLQIDSVDGSGFSYACDRAKGEKGLMGLLNRLAVENAPESDTQPRDGFEIDGEPWIATEVDGYWEIWVDNIVAHALEQKDIRKAIGAKKIAWRTEGQPENAYWNRPIGDEDATVEAIVAHAAKEGKPIEWIIGVKTASGIGAARKAVRATTVAPC